VLRYTVLTAFAVVGPTRAADDEARDAGELYPADYFRADARQRAPRGAAAPDAAERAAAKAEKRAADVARRTAVVLPALRRMFGTAPDALPPRATPKLDVLLRGSDAAPRRVFLPLWGPLVERIRGDARITDAASRRHAKRTGALA